MDPMMDAMEDIIYSPDGYPLYPDFATRGAVEMLHPEDVACLVFEGVSIGPEAITVTDVVLITRIIRALQNAYMMEPTFTDQWDTLAIFVRTPDKPRRVASFRFLAGDVGDFGPEFQAIMRELGWVDD